MLAEAIDKSFGSFDEFKSKFNEAAKTRFVRWSWLVVKIQNLKLFLLPIRQSIDA